MKKSRFSEEQITFALKQVEAGVPIVEICRKMGIAEPTFYRWKKLYGSLMPSEVKRLKQLEEENSRLKRLGLSRTKTIAKSMELVPCWLARLWVIFEI